MDFKRFDSFTKSLAQWSSRRKFLGGLSGAAIGGALVPSQRVSAQFDALKDNCGPAFSKDNADDVALRKLVVDLSLQTLDGLATPDKFGSPEIHYDNEVPFYDFVARVHCLLAHAAHINDGDFNGDELRFIIDMADGLVTSMAIGVGESIRPREQVATSVPTPDPAATPSADPCLLPGCITDLLAIVLVCKNEHKNKNGDVYKCYTDFFRKLIGNASKETCLIQYATLCRESHQCCLHGCCPPGCGYP